MGRPGSHTPATRFSAGFGEPPPGLDPAQLAKGRIALGWLALFGGAGGFAYRFVPDVLGTGVAGTVYAASQLTIVFLAIGLLLFERWAQLLLSALITMANVAVGASMLGFSDPRAFANPLILIFPVLFSAGLLTRRWFILQCVATLVILLLIPRTIYSSTWGWLTQVGWNSFALLLSAFAVRFLRRQVIDALARSERLSNTDFLTGLSNRRDVDRRAPGILNTASRTDSVVAALVLDLDYFKSVNDTHGHHIGDLVLVRVADAVRACARADDLIARTGGEEILVLAVVDAGRNATTLGERLVEAVADIEVNAPTGVVRVTCSVGVATCGPMPLDGNEQWLWRLVTRADSALLRAKRRGRGRCMAEAPDAPAEPAARHAPDQRVHPVSPGVVPPLVPRPSEEPAPRLRT